MSEQYIKPGERYMGQKVLFPTEKWGKVYYMMEDGDGTIYMVRCVDGLPDFS